MSLRFDLGLDFEVRVLMWSAVVTAPLVTDLDHGSNQAFRNVHVHMTEEVFV